MELTASVNDLTIMIYAREVYMGVDQEAQVASFH